MKWEKNRLDTVRYECASCKAELSEFYKKEMIEKGEWRRAYPERRKHAGFHINELYSPWSTWRNVVESFLEAKKRHETLKVWINTTLGESWEDEESYSISDETLSARVEDYIDVPTGVLLLTAGVDVQDDRVECLVKGWGLQDESWFVDYKIIPGSPAKPEVWNMVDEYLTRRWKHESGITLSIISACIDSAGHFTQNVYQFVKQRQHRRIYAVKGMAGVGRPIVSKPSINNRLKVSLFTLGVDTAKELIYARLQIDTQGIGYIHFSRRCDEEYFKQLTAEKQVTKFSKGFPTKVWVKVRTRNEALDCEVYALAAFTILNADMEAISAEFTEEANKLNRDENSRQEEESVDNNQRRRGSDVRKFPRRSNWVNSW